jgi:leucyl-tRNA synthetase
VEGIYRFLGRVYRLIGRHSEAAQAGEITAQRSVGAQLAASPASLSPAARGLQRKLHQTIKRVSHDFEGRWHFNTSIAAIMEFVNELYAAEGHFGKEIPNALLAEIEHKLVLLLYPFAPYLAHELWEMLGEQGSLLQVPWPEYDAALAKEEEIEIPVQINGKLRSRIVVAVDAPEDEIRQRALAEPKIQAAIAGKQIVKVIVVSSKLVNVVVR